MAYNFDINTTIKSIMDKILQINLLLVFYTDSKSLYNYFIWLGTTQEKYFIINVICLRQTYERKQIIEVK
jgi:hypothetical protein